MNALGISLIWMALQMTLFCLVGAVVYLVARRRHPTWGASVLCGVLMMTVGIATLSISPWPQWWTLDDARLAAQGSLAANAPTNGLGQPSPGAAPADGATSEARQRAGASEVPAAVWNLLSGLWGKVHNQLADRAPADVTDPPGHWPAWLAAMILSSMGIGLARVLLGWVALTRLLRETRPVHDPSLLCLIEQLCAELHCRRPIEAREMTCDGGGSPAVVGWRRPIILLPANWRSWSEEARRGILAHEMAHVAHGDFLMGLAAQAGVVIHFYNPLVHWLAHRLRLEQELAADACGAALAGGARAYATILAQMALGQDDFRPLWAGRPFFPTRGTLMRRIEMLQNRTIIAGKAPSRLALAVVLATLALIGLCVSGVRGPDGRARAAEPATEESTAKIESQPANDGLLPAFDDSYLPADTIAVMSVKPLHAAGSSVVVEPVLNSFPFAFGLAFTAKERDEIREWEVDEVKMIAFSAASNKTLAPVSPDSAEPAGLGIYRMRKPYKQGELRVKLFGEAPDGASEATCHGYPCLRATSEASGHLVNYLMVDDRTIVIVRDRDVPRVLALDPKSHPSWYGEWQKMADSPLAVAFDSAAMHALDEPEKESAEEIFFSVLKDTSYFIGHVDSTAEGMLISGSALCKSPEAAVKTCQAANATLALARMAVPQLVAPSGLPKEYQTLDIGASLTDALGSLKANADAARVDVQGKLDAAFVARFSEATKILLARQTEELKAREKVDETAHVAKLARLVEAFNAYHDEHGHYPPAAVVGPDGKTVHSWRVELLPYLGEQKLFDEYKLDEPWDSDHNKPLVEKIPSIYSTSQWSGKGHADYFVVTGKGTLFDANAPIQRESVSDAAGETILVLESRQRIPWTKPVDIETSADHNVLRPFRHGKGFYAAFADGTVKLVAKETDAASVRAMFTKAGGDQVKLR